jgi:DNA helicase-2/ATP-dependent DNA helicase PcrA
VPAEPSPQARRGTRFHAWVEGWYGSASLVDVDALPGADDDSGPLDLDEQALREAFLATPWANRSPVAVEVDIETSVDGYVLRSRIDAVFPDPDAEAARPGVVVVDWKTGAPPKDEAARASRELQLAVYRLAWSRWTGTPVDRVRAAFCYVGAGVTVYPERLLDEAEITALLQAATRADASQGAGAVAPRVNRRGPRSNAPARRRPGWEAAPARRPAAPTLFDTD